MNAPDWLVARPIAHRGLHDAAAGRIENTLSAADAAIAGGYPIECDVQDTADGEAVVFHDFTLDRLTAEDGFVHARA
ncbi:MAG TPA: glycerophosphodiester phosphodiesterase family protein, partial [Beijerinckiaceae bacterium]|nr:glycerophosphodiester phosphodiesterase family protein [Beijerinckiaceae bacterium]